MTHHCPSAPYGSTLEGWYHSRHNNIEYLGKILRECSTPEAGCHFQTYTREKMDYFLALKR